MEETTDKRVSPSRLSAGSSSESEEDEEPGMVVTREKRFNAGNRMAKLMAMEEPEAADGDAEEYYGQADWNEAADDDEFSEKDAGPTDDIPFETSSDEDEEEDEYADDSAGEKMLQKQMRAERTSKKRKLTKAVFKQPTAAKKSKTTIGTSVEQATTVETSRPKKKVERVSWIPTDIDAPVRTSSRAQTMDNRKEVHRRLKKKEEVRLAVVANMKAAEEKKKSRPPPLTQEQRLAMAAQTEEENIKTLNVWEQQEELRQEERRKKLEALKNRCLEGQVIRWWSGPAVWVDGKLAATGKTADPATITDKLALDAEEARSKQSQTDEPTPSALTDQKAASTHGTGNDIEMQDAAELPNGSRDPALTDGKTKRDEDIASLPHQSTADTAPNPQHAEQLDLAKPGPTEIPTIMDVDKATEPLELAVAESDQQEKSAPDVPKGTNAAQDPSGMTASPVKNDNFQAETSPSDNNQHPRNTSEPAARSTTGEQPPPAPSTDEPATSQPATTTKAPDHDHSHDQHAVSPPPQPLAPEAPPSEPQEPQPTPPPPTIEHSLRSLITLRGYGLPRAPTRPRERDRDRETLVRTLLSWPNEISSSAATSSSSKHKHTSCAITGKSARYCDPVTRLPYHDVQAYRMIGLMKRGGARWSNLLGAFVGRENGGIDAEKEKEKASAVDGIVRAAAGVPQGFAGSAG